MNGVIKTARYIARCKRCRYVAAYEVQANPQRVTRGYGRTEISYDRELRQMPQSFLLCPSGHHCGIRRVHGSYVATVPCDARCTNAVGHSCECSCGGKNHGSGHVMKYVEKEVPVVQV